MRSKRLYIDKKIGLAYSIGSCPEECAAITCLIWMLDLDHDKVVLELRLKIIRTLVSESEVELGS